MRFAIPGVALLLALGGCAAPTSEPHRPDTATLAACTAEGGTLERRGKLATPRCVHPFADAGKACSGKADCAGKCIAVDPEAAATQSPAAGTCQRDDALFGCYAEVDAGTLKPTICVD